MRLPTSVYAGLLSLALTNAASAQVISVLVTIENPLPANGLSFAPLRLGFNNGTYDSFNNGTVASPAIVSVAEGGSGSAWFPAFAAAQPSATLGSVGGATAPGQTASAVFSVNYTTSPFFTFGSMVIPSNDYFIGNDAPTQYRLFDASGNLLITSINQRASDIWDAGSELFDPANAAFLVGGTNALRTPQNGIVNFDFAELTGFNGLTTAAGYTLNSQLSASTDVYRITFAAVPEPTSIALMIAAGAGWAVRRLRRKA